MPTPAPSAPSGEAATPAATPAPSAAAPVASAPIVPATPAATPVATPAAVANAASARPVLLPQIAGPVVALAQAPDGDHRLTLTVSPENLGPVTVRAHISGGAIHIELHAPNDLGREALRSVLADLRRDLAAAAPHASLMLSSSDDGPGSSNPQSSSNGGGAPNSTTAGTGGGQPRGEGSGDRNREARPAPSLLPSPPDAASPVTVPPHGGIDVYA
ncbi:flagellar hook-length control protein FliK [Microbacterium sp. Se63.02b]|uniref:flagellar hook-length control protein FliK n=1 Tax=Microbacterium sp. Se63.02b TaxID=2709304 RepID=UPI001AEF25C6|nr:flagellar hook-length control protein FliK [Microbacterium sp. Se63.02b]